MMDAKEVDDGLQWVEWTTFDLRRSGRESSCCPFDEVIDKTNHVLRLVT